MATSFLLRKSLTIPGAITLTGNTLGLTDRNYPYTFLGPGALFSTTFTYTGNDMGAFITTDTSRRVPGYPAGSTSNWGENSSMAILKLPQGAIIRHAELIWGGATRGNGSNTTSPVNLDSQINTPVRFKTPGGRIFNISPDGATAGTATVGHVVATVNGIRFPYSGGDQVYYVRSQNVTDIVKQFGAGQYECGGVVANVVPFGPGLMRCAGWDLVVMYELPTLPVRNLTLFLGIDAVGSDGVASVNYSNGTGTSTIIPGEIKGPRDINVSGFVTPESGTVNARVLLSGMEGDPQFGIGGRVLGIGDRVYFGPNTGVLTELQGPNNRIGNFLAAQINDDSGNLDTSGTFGSLNQNPNGSAVGAINRNTWDITNLSGLGVLPNSQRSAVVRIVSETDEYALHLLALQIDVNAPKIQVTKQVDKQNANVGDTITYTVVVKNTGTTTATNVIFKDSIPNDTSFVSGSVTVNGTPNPSAIPNPPGFSIPDLPPNGVHTVTFKVKINKLPTPNPILNQALIDFQYKPAPDLPSTSGSSGSNTVNTLVEQAPNPSVEAIKSVDKTSAVVGDTILYTVDFVNTGNVQLNNVIFRDTTPNGTSFVPGSVLIDNASRPTENPQTGVNLSELAVGERVTIKWNVKIDTLPSPNPIPNTGFINYNYAGANNATIPGTTGTNTVNTNVANATPGLQVIKAVDKVQAAIGEVITYTTTFTNTGNIPLTNVIFRDTLPNGVSLIPNTTKINGVDSIGNVQTGINVGTLPIGNKITVEFKVRIDTIPNPNPIPNTSEVVYNFAPGPGQSPLEGSVISNIVTTNVFEGINPVLKIDKEVSQTEANVGDILTYTIGIKNDGNVNLTNVIIKDTIPNGTSLVPGSIELNFTPVPGGDIQAGINIPALPQNGLAVITFKVKINQVPIPNPIPNVAIGTANYIDVTGTTKPISGTSNQVNTNVNIPRPNATIEKANNKVKAVVGESITYSVRIRNTGTVDLNNVVFKDTIPNGTSFVNGSVLVNGVANAAANPQSGFSLDSIPVGGSVVVQFVVLITTTPNPNPIPNTANINYTYTTNQSNPNGNTGALTSNTVLTEVVNVRAELIKQVDKTNAQIGDTITYTIFVNNPSTVPLEGVILKDTIPNGTTFVPNSVEVNDVPRSGSPQDGIDLGTINGGTQKVVKFKVTITTIPNPNPIPNVGVINYGFRPDPTSPLQPGGGTTNTVTTQVGSSGTGDASITKTVDKINAVVGDVITYTSVIRNTGTLPLTNLVFTDGLESSRTTFVPGSVIVDGAANPSGNPVTGIPLADLPVGGVHTITFRVSIDAIPVPNPIPNKSNIAYTYTPNGGSPTNGNKDSNTVTTQVQIPADKADISIAKSVDKTVANIGDTLTYAITVSNIGDVDVFNVIVTDTIQASNVTFIPGSVTVNGAANVGNPSNGINIGRLTPGQTIVVVYRVQVNGTPVPNPIPNSANGKFDFLLITGGQQTADKDSNTVNTQINPPVGTGDASITKAVDKTITNVGEELIYTSVIRNTGTLLLTNVIFTDAIEASNVSFVQGSVTVNGVPNQGNPSSGVNVGSLAVGQSVTVVFKVRVNAIPTPNPIPNKSNVGYTYTPNGGTPQTGNKDSNIVNTTVNTPGGNPELILVKSVDKSSASVGDIITYAVTATNTGMIDLTNVIVTDTLQASNISIIPGSLAVDGIPNTSDIQTGVNIGNLAIGETVILTYRVRIDGTPNPNPIPNAAGAGYTYTRPGGTPTQGTSTSNLVNTNVQGSGGSGDASIVKAVDKGTANIGDEITYTSTIQNTGTLPLTNVVFTDAIEASGVTFVSGSVTVNGTANSGNPSSGINVGNLAVGQTVIVVFKVKINSAPTPNPIPNKSNVQYTYTSTGGSPVTTNEDSNTVITQVNSPDGNPNTTIVKSVDKTNANIGDTLNYGITVTNTGNLNLTNLIVTDTIQASNVSFVQGSLTVNGVPNAGNIQSGVNVGNLAVGQSVLLTYRVTVNGVPVPNPIPNTAIDIYNYTNSSGGQGQGGNTSNQVQTLVNTPGGIGNALVTKTTDKVTAVVGDIITYTLDVLNDGTLPLENVIVKDVLSSSNVSFVQGSLTVNGIANGGNIQTGVNIGSLGVGQRAVIVFRVRVDGIPTPNPIPNKGSVNYTYTPTGGTPQTGGNESNTVNTNVSSDTSRPITTLVKEVDKTVSDIGGIITYTLRASNTGTSTANNVVITDVVPQDTTFVQNSVTVNGSPRPSDNPEVGVNIGSLAPGQSVVLTYRAKLVDGRLPNPNPVLNTGSLNYSYTPVGGTPQNVNLTSNQVSTQVNSAIITPGTNTANPGAVKRVDKTIAQVGDILTYTINLTNSGNITTNTTTLTDIIPNDTSFLAGSVAVDGFARPSDNPQNGISVGPIAPGGTSTVIFRVRVDRVPNPNPIPNKATINYTYKPDSAGPDVSKGTETNTVTTTVGRVPIEPGTGVIKEGSKSYAQVGDTITYTIRATNTGTVDATNLLFRDILPNGVSFVPNTVKVDGIDRGGVSPEAGFNIGNLAPGATRIVTFDVKVTQIPNPNPIENIGELTYTYTLDPTKPPTTITVPTNPVPTQVNIATINTESGGLIKSVDKAYARVGDVITYTVNLRNTGNVNAENVSLRDIIPNDTSFVLGSVTVNGTPFASVNPQSGIPIGTIRPNGTAVVTFKVKINKIPNPNPIPNKAEVNYSYTVDPSRPNGVNITNQSNTVTTNVNQGIIDPNTGGLIKETDKEFASVGDTITYTIKIKNTGNIKIDNVIFKDTIPNGTSFIPNTFTIDGGIIPNANPQNGVNVGSINQGDTKIVTFKVLVTTIPVPNPIKNSGTINYEFVVNPITGEKGPGSGNTNEVSTKVNEASIDPTKGDLVKSRDKEFAAIGEEITYTIRIRNSGNIDAENVVFYDTIPNGTRFVSNSVIVDGASKANQSPASGVSIGTIRQNQTVVVVFRVLVTELPIPNPIPNQGAVDYRYLVDPITSKYKDDKALSNIVYTQVNEAILKPEVGGIEKTVDKDFARVGDIITYTVTLRNRGNVNANNVILMDTIPNGTQFVANSVLINNVASTGTNPQQGIPVGVIEPNAAVQVQFKVKVVSIPNPNPIPNKGEVSFSYTANPNNPNGEKGNEISNTTLTKVNSANIGKEDGGLIKAVDKAFADVGEVITYTITLRNTGNVNAENVVMLDTVPSGTTFIQGSVTVNGQNISGANPENGIQVGTISPSGNVRISYKVKVTEMPNPNPIPNTANVSYSFITNPQAPVQTNVTNTSNEVVTKVNSPNINPNNGSVTKAVDKGFAKVGEELTYTISVTNKGNIVATNVVINDTVPEGTRFINNSVTINGVTQVGADPSLGVNVSEVLPGNTVVLTYKVTVITIPKVNPIPNKADVSYSFTKDPNRPNSERVTVQTNEVLTKVNSASIDPSNGGLIKSVDKQYADLGDVLTFTVRLSNTGNVDANNVKFLDTIPEGTEFVEGSLRVNGIERGENPQNGVLLGSIAPNETVIISFKVKVTKVLSPNLIKNRGNVQYTFTKDPARPNGEGENKETNQTTTVINSANISPENGGLIKTVSKEYASISDELVYTIFITNKGNVAAEDVVLKDTIPNGTRFIEGSVLVNGNIQSASNPANGINLGLIPISGKATVQYKVKVISIPNPNPIPNKAQVAYRYLVNPITSEYNNKENTSNTVLTKVNTADIGAETGGIIKTVDKAYADLNDIVTYTVKIQNKGNTDAIKVTLRDTIPKNTIFIENSVAINGVVKIGANPENGVFIDKIAPGEIYVMTFKVRVNSIPNPNIINNNAYVDYSYVVDPNSQKEVDKTGISNNVTTTINSGNIDPHNGGIVKLVNKEYASIGEELSYTIKIKNTGNIKVENVIIRDTVPDSTIFISGSILVNGIQRAGDNLASGVNIGTLDQGEEAIITYKVKVYKIPSENPIKNTAEASYTYTVDPNKPNGIRREVVSNTVLTKVSFADISKETGGLVKSVDKKFTDLGQEITYTITLINKGNTNANNIVLKDTIPTGTSFVLNSVLVNNNGVFGANPSLGINVGILEPNKIAVVSFKVIATTIPVDGIINNQANINYTYTKNPDNPNGVSKEEDSNIVQTLVRTGVVTPGTIPTDPNGKPIIGPNGKPLPPTGGFIKTADKDYVQIGDVVTYTFKVENSGNIAIENVVVTDLVPNGMEFVKGSISVDGVIDQSANANLGVNIGSIKAGSFKTLSFKSRVTKIPETNPIKNKGVVSYEYTVDPGKPPIKNETISNEVNVTVNGARIDSSDGGLIKQVDKSFAEINDILTYTVILKNTGNIKANNVVLRDTIPTGTSFVPGSVTVNGNVEITLNPQTGIGILVLNPGQTSVISFKVKIDKLNPDFKISNNALVNYDFVVNPNNPPVSSSSLSNTVVTKENSVNFGGENFKKSVDHPYASLGDTVMYTFTIKNTGNIMATNVTFKDDLNDVLSFVKGSLEINGISIPSANPEESVSLGSIGVNGVSTISFKAIVVSIPKNPLVENIAILGYASQINPNGDPVFTTLPSNKEDILIKDPKIGVVKSSDNSEVVVGEVINYTIKVTNTGNTEAINVKVSDSLSSNIKFVEGSVVINDKVFKDYNISSGIVIDKILVGETKVVKFKAIIIKRPESGKVSNVASVSYNYITDPNKPPRGNNIDSNKVTIRVEEAKVVVSKSSNISFAKIDDIIEYTVTMENVGTLDALNLIFFDSISNGVKYIEGSFNVNGRTVNSVNLSTGINLGNLKPGEKLVIKYRVTLTHVGCDRKIKNAAYGKFEYKILDKSSIGVMKTDVAKHVVIGQSPNFRQMNMDGVITLDCHMPPIEEVNEVKAAIEVTNYYVIDTMVGRSPENSKLTGQKLVVNGYIHETIEYTALVERQSAHYTCRTKKFSTFIVIQGESTLGAEIRANALIEDVSFKQLNDRQLYTNITFNLEANINN